MAKVDPVADFYVNLVLIIHLAFCWSVSITKGAVLNYNVLRLLSQSHVGDSVRGTKVNDIGRCYFCDFGPAG
jgi:hypothetical protein